MDSPPIAPDGLVLSHSRVSLYADCGEKYRLTYLEEWPKSPQGALIAGNVVHDVIDDMEKAGQMLDPACFGDGTVSHTRFLLKFQEAVEEAGGPDAINWTGRKTKEFPNGRDYGWWQQFGPGMVNRAHAVRQLDEEQGLKVVHSEIEVNAVLPSGGRITTRIDQLLEGAGGYAVRDWKTSSQPRSSSRLQNTLYGYAVEQTLGVRPAFGHIVYLAMAALRADVFELEPLEGVALEWIAQVERGIQQGVFTMNPGSFCSSCQVRAGCAWGRALIIEEEASSA